MSDDDYYEEEDSSSYNITDPVTGKPRLCASECSTCIFNAQSPVTRGLRRGRLKSLIDSARQGGSYVVCHSTFGEGAAACRGFVDRYSTNLIRIFERLGGWVEVEPPSLKGNANV